MGQTCWLLAETTLQTLRLQQGGDDVMFLVFVFDSDKMTVRTILILEDKRRAIVQEEDKRFQKEEDFYAQKWPHNIKQRKASLDINPN